MPIRYVAELIGADTDSERAIQWLIALMVLCCDPLAIALKIEKAAVGGERRTVEADLTPVKYLATMLGQADEVILRWFILVVALLDPAAVLLLLAASARR
jgi:hypothetical protein